ncbi:MAG: hypothetical protein H7144_15270 [Burkholderiales bacterium]|nr:hypothetical protein [Phycisphaerae bacterium]
MSFEINDEEVRRIERDVLDPFHLSLELFKHDHSDARLAALAAFDGMSLPWMISTSSGVEPTVTQRLLIKQYEDGLSQAMRWLTQKGQPTTLGNAITKELLAAGFEFVHHAGEYSNLADFHRLYSSNLMLASVDLVGKRVRFDHCSNDRGFESAMGFMTSVRHEKARAAESDQTILKGSPRAIVPFHLLRGMVHLSYPERLRANDPDFELPKPPSVIEAGTNLSGFSVEDLATYWAALSMWSTYALLYYLEYARTGIPQDRCMPTQLYSRTRYLSAMQANSGLDSEKVLAITNRLTYDYRTITPCIFQQPLLVDGSNIAWSPFVVILSRYDRNMLRLMARTPEHKALADNVIGGRERSMLRQLGSYLQTYGWSFKLNRRITDGSTEREIDLLGYSTTQQNTVLVVEWKTILTIDEVHEVRAATKELIRAQDQALKKIELLKRMTVSQKKAVYPFVEWDKVNQYVPLVVTPDAEPNETFDHNKVPSVSLATLQSFSKHRHLRSPLTLHEFAKTRSWNSEYNSFVHTHDDVRIGDYVYEIPILAEPEASPHRGGEQQIPAIACRNRQA